MDFPSSEQDKQDDDFLYWETVIADSTEMNPQNTFIKLYKSYLAMHLMSALKLGR